MSLMKFSLLLWEPWVSFRAPVLVHKWSGYVPDKSHRRDNLIDRLTSMGASVLSKVTPVSQEASLLLSRSKADCVCILFMGCVAVMEMSGAGADVALLLFYLWSLWSSSLHPHSGGTSVSVVSKEAAAADKQLLCSLMASLWRQHDCGAKWQTSLRLSSYRSRPLVFVERFIPSHASKNTHSNTRTLKNNIKVAK